MTQPAHLRGEWGSFTCADGRSRPFKPDSTVLREVIARELAAADGWNEIRPTHWAAAGRVAQALKDAGYPARPTARGKHPHAS